MALDFSMTLSAVMSPLSMVDGRVGSGDGGHIGDAGLRGKFIDPVGAFTQPIGKIPGRSTTLSMEFFQPVHAKLASRGYARWL